MTDAANHLRIERREERALVAPHRGRFEARIVTTFVVQAAAYVGVIAATLSGAVPIWLGFVANTVLATMFYMPLHEAAHGNIWGSHRRARLGEDLIGMLSAIPVGFSYKAHRMSHMRHHAYTNDPTLDPDIFTQGPLREIPLKAWTAALVQTLIPLLAFVPASRVLLPRRIREQFTTGGLRTPQEDRLVLRFWIVSHLALLAAFVGGVGIEALLLWYIPTRIQIGWLLFVFAWYPHHPATEVGRYVDTRVAVFPGSTILIRGHDHHALHHLFPRVPHYRLPRLWREIGPSMVEKGVRAEGRAVAATGPVVW